MKASRMQTLYYVEKPIPTIGACRGDLIVDDRIGGLSLIHRMGERTGSVRSLPHASVDELVVDLRTLPRKR